MCKEKIVFEPKPAKRTYSVQEVMLMLEVSRPTVYELIKNKEFRAVRVGAQWKISKKNFMIGLIKQRKNKLSSIQNKKKKRIRTFVFLVFFFYIKNQLCV